MKHSTLGAVIFGILTTLGSVANPAQAAVASLVNLECQLKNGNELSAILDGPNQQLVIDNSVFQFMKVNPEGQGEALIFQKADSLDQVIASLNISVSPIRLAVLDDMQASQYTCTHAKA